MSKKIIRLMENELNEILKNTTKEVLKEMTTHIKTFKIRIDWCLCKY